MLRRYALVLLTLFAAAIGFAAASQPQSFRFVILGDRTGEVQSGVYEQVWREVAAERPAFVLSVGDTIQGLNDETARDEWRRVFRVLAPFRSIPLYLTPGNHDVWSAKSASLYREFAGHPPHYSFDFHQLHVTVLDNSRSNQLSAGEMQFLEDDLKIHSRQPLKMVISHRPSWLLPVVFGASNSPFHQLMKKYRVDYVIAGHIHQMLRFQLDRITYLSMPSAGGHLRASKAYGDGWFFGHTLVEVHGNSAQFQIEEAMAPVGQGRVTVPSDWGATGLVNRAQSTIIIPALPSRIAIGKTSGADLRRPYAILEKLPMNRALSLE
jgi:3',5'-cyclic-AMP phosphodiesterase